MIAKLFEVRDIKTFIPVLAVQLGSDDEAERYLAARSGYGRTRLDQEGYVFITRIDGNDIGGTYAPYGWPSGTRTMKVAHEFIAAHFGELEPGAVVDVEHILGETEQPKQSERLDKREVVTT